MGSESRSEFLEKLQRARSQVKPVTASQPILSSVAPTKLTVGNWSLTCLKEGEIAIHNSDGQQATILKEDLPGFVFESNRGTKHSFTAETSLGECSLANDKQAPCPLKSIDGVEEYVEAMSSVFSIISVSCYFCNLCVVVEEEAETFISWEAAGIGERINNTIK